MRRVFGHGFGRPVDRYYIEAFLERYRLDIRGAVLEVQDSNYTHLFGKERVTHSAVLDAKPGNPRATIVADLTDGEGIPSESFDCIILTQTMQYIYDVRMAVRTIHRILKPGGVLLATFPGISQISRNDMNQWGEYWRFTSLAARRLFSEVFPGEHVTVKAHGNVLVAMGFLHGLVCEEMGPDELAYDDPDYELSVTVRAVKLLETSASSV